METWKVITNGALGSLTFGIYWFYITNNMMKENNEKLEKQLKENIKN